MSIRDHRAVAVFINEQCLFAVHAMGVSICISQVYAALKQRHPQQTTKEQLNSLLADLKVTMSALCYLHSATLSLTPCMYFITA